VGTLTGVGAPASSSGAGVAGAPPLALGASVAAAAVLLALGGAELVLASLGASGPVEPPVGFELPVPTGALLVGVLALSQAGAQFVPGALVPAAVGASTVVSPAAGGTAALTVPGNSAVLDALPALGRGQRRLGTAAADGDG
jgi:hypothetical protein